MPSEATLDPHLLEQLPTLPGSAVAFIEICDDMTVGVRDVAAVAQSDPALVAKILQVANSPYYSPREPVADVVRAAAILGLRSLKMIGVGFAIVGDLWNNADRSDELAQVIGASAIAGSGARSFSARVGTGRDEEALTAGLLSFVGELAMLKCYPRRMAELWATHEGPPPPQVLADEFGADGPTLGSMLMNRWSIPTELRVGVTSRTMELEVRLARRTEVFEASAGFGTAIAELLLDPQRSLGDLKQPARAWGFSDRDLAQYWSDFRLAVRHTSRQLQLNVAADLDALILDAREEYFSSEVHTATELAAAHRRIGELEAENERLEGLSLQDPLTEIPNRAAFEKVLRSAIASASRSPDVPRVGVALFDLDMFKAINDTQGHLVGDALLTTVARAAASAVRTDELFARLGGDEFAMVLRPGSFDEMGIAVERIRQTMNDAAASMARGGRATISAGAAMLADADEDLDDSMRRVVRAADDALYTAKRSGRNRTALADAPRLTMVAPRTA